MKKKVSKFGEFRILGTSHLRRKFNLTLNSQWECQSTDDFHGHLMAPLFQRLVAGFAVNIWFPCSKDLHGNLWLACQDTEAQ